jgi:hypothetical protein
MTAMTTLERGKHCQPDPSELGQVFPMTRARIVVGSDHQQAPQSHCQVVDGQIEVVGAQGHLLPYPVPQVVGRQDTCVQCPWEPEMVVWTIGWPRVVAYWPTHPGVGKEKVGCVPRVGRPEAGFGTLAGGTLVGDIGTMAGSIGTLAGDIGTLAGGTLAGDIGTMAGYIGTLAGGTLAGDIGTMAGDIGMLVAEIGTMAGSIGTLAGDIGTLAGDIGTLVAEIGTMAGCTGTLAGGIETLTGVAGVVEVAGENLSKRHPEKGSIKEHVPVHLDRERGWCVLQYEGIRKLRWWHR